MRTRLKLLTVGLVLVTAAVAGCSSTTAGPAGAIQDEATAPASSSSSAGPTSSAAPVTPTAAPTEAPASPVASPTDSPSPLGSCAEGGVCQLGDPGPGGGVVLYVASSPFTCGANMASFCNYLEAAPNLWASNSKSTCKETGSACGGSSNDQYTSDFSYSGGGITFCTGTGWAALSVSGQKSAIGMGYANTTDMVGVCNSWDAGNAARSYDGGELTDWSLGSLEEMSALNSYADRAAIGGFNSGTYWTSTPTNGKLSGGYAFTENFKSGQGSGPNMGMTAYEGVRPTRAF